MSEMMKTEKLNELLGEVIHIACAAELASDEQIKVQAIGDIYDALASVMPVDHGTKAKARGEGEENAKAVREGADRTGFAKFLAASDDVRFVRFSGNGETRLLASRRGTCGNNNAIFEIRVDHEEDFATVYRDKEIMFTIRGMSIGHSFVEKLAISCMHRYLKENKMTNEKRKRKRARKAAEREEAAGREGAARTGEEA